MCIYVEGRLEKAPLFLKISAVWSQAELGSRPRVAQLTSSAKTIITGGRAGPGCGEKAEMGAECVLVCRLF